MIGLLTISFPGSTVPTANAQTPPAVDQCNNIGSTPASLTVNCTVTVVNTIDGATTSSTITVARSCTNGPCTGGGNTVSTTTTSASLVTSVTQCNGSSNDSGSVVTCTVDIT